MDVHKEYHDPRQLIDEMIRAGELSGFAIDMYDGIADAKLWEFFLARVNTGSFDDFKESLRKKDSHHRETGGMSAEQIIAQTLDIAAMTIVTEEVMD